MDSIALINTSEARIYLGSVGYITRHLSFGADYLIVNVQKQTVVSSIFTQDEPLFDLKDLAPLILLPDSKSRSLYMLSEGLVTRFHPRITKEIYGEYIASLNASVLSQQQNN